MSRLWSRAADYVDRYGPRNSVFLKSAGTSNTSALTPAVDTDTNSDVMVMSGIRPSGSAGAAVGADGSAVACESSFFLWNMEPSLPAIAPARPPGVVGVESLLESDCCCWDGAFLHCVPPKANAKLVFTG